MRSLLFITIFYFFSFGCIAQNKTNILGTWQTINAGVSENYLMEGEKKKMINSIIAKLKDSSFEFLNNNVVTFQSGIPEMDIQKGYWHYDDQNKIISIYNAENQKDKLLIIEIKQYSDSSATFYLNETPLILKVQKN